MSDYLNNLVARTLNLAPVVQPRLKSLFEPTDAPASIAGNAALPGSATESRAARPGGAAFADNLQSGSDLVASRTAAWAPSAIRKNRFGGEPEDDDESHQDRTSLARTPASPASAPMRADPPGTSGAGLATAVDSNRLPAQLLAHHQTRLRAVQARVVERGPTRSAESKNQVESTEGLVPPHPGGPSPSKSSPRDTIEFVTTAAAAPISDSAPAPGQLPFNPPGSAAAYSANRSDEAPTISVTIGRIDVRAIFAPPPVQRPGRAARPAAMSLDEYYKQRGGGRR